MSQSKKNCWEVKKCGREPGGVNAQKSGVCPASIEARADGINGGRNAGRICWAVAGTFCEGEAQGTYAEKLKSCLECDFYRMMWREDRDQILADSEKLKSLKLKATSKKA